jgi:hypothetical protein
MNLKKLGKSGMFGLAGLAASNPDITNKIARKGGLGLMGILAAKKKRAAESAGMDGAGMGGAPTMGGRPGTMGDSGENTQQFKRGGKVKKMAKGGSASRRGDGIATKGKTKGKFV